MRIALVMPFFDEAVVEPEAMLSSYPLLRELPAELAALDHDVSMLLHAPVQHTRTERGVRYEWIPPRELVLTVGRALNRWKPRHGPAYYQPNLRLVRRLRQLRPHVVHTFGLTLDLHLALIARDTSRRGTPLLVHYHGGLPAIRSRHRRLQRFNLARVDRVLFTSAEQAIPWINAGLLTGLDRVVQIVETSSPFHGLSRDEARARTRMYGDPVCLSAGRLHPIKDPLTTLRGFERIAAARPQARLFLYYLSDELLPELRAFVAAIDGLAERVEFRGRAELNEMEAIYSSADFLLQASTREWSGLAVLEAISCGCIPIVSDIPSFRSLTDDGRAGRLFPIGDDVSMAQAVLSLDAVERAVLASRVRAHFERELSFAAMARRLDGVYRELHCAAAASR